MRLTLKRAAERVEIERRIEADAELPPNQRTIPVTS
jgi:hypothetical protein